MAGPGGRWTGSGAKELVWSMVRMMMRIGVECIYICKAYLEDRIPVFVETRSGHLRVVLLVLHGYTGERYLESILNIEEFRYPLSGPISKVVYVLYVMLDLRENSV